LYSRLQCQQEAAIIDGYHIIDQQHTASCCLLSNSMFGLHIIPTLKPGMLPLNACQSMTCTWCYVKPPLLCRAGAALLPAGSPMAPGDYEVGGSGASGAAYTLQGKHKERRPDMKPGPGMLALQAAIYQHSCCMLSQGARSCSTTAGAFKWIQEPSTPHEICS
jgi:hypothetical protein